MRARHPDVRREDRFRTLYVEHHGSIYAYVHRRLAASEGEVHDVVADVFAVVWRRLDELPPAPEDRLWLYGVARRCVLRARRSGLRRRQLQARLRGEVRAGPADTEQSGDAPAVQVRDAIDRLRPIEREVLRLTLWEGLTHAEAASVLGCSVNAVGLRLHKARQHLRADLVAPHPDSVSELEPRS